MSHFKLSTQNIADFKKDGSVIIKNFLQTEEVNKLYKIATGDDTLQKHAFDLNDQSGKKTKLTLWYTPGNIAYGSLTKGKRIVESVYSQALFLSRPCPMRC